MFLESIHNTLIAISIRIFFKAPEGACGRRRGGRSTMRMAVTGGPGDAGPHGSTISSCGRRFARGDRAHPLGSELVKVGSLLPPKDLRLHRAARPLGAPSGCSFVRARLLRAVVRTTNQGGDSCPVIPGSFISAPTRRSQGTGATAPRAPRAGMRETWSRGGWIRDGRWTRRG